MMFCFTLGVEKEEFDCAEHPAVVDDHIRNSGCHFVPICVSGIVRAIVSSGSRFADDTGEGMCFGFWVVNIVNFEYAVIGGMVTDCVGN